MDHVLWNSGRLPNALPVWSSTVQTVELGGPFPMARWDNDDHGKVPMPKQKNRLLGRTPLRWGDFDAPSSARDE